MRLDPGDPEDSGLNLTPLIDIVFLLLIFFLVSTTFARDEVEMDLQLPEASTGEEAAEGHLIVINVKRNGELFVDGRPVTVAALEQKLKAAARRDKKQEVLIRGDTQTQFGVVVQVLDLCRAAPLTQIAIGEEPREGN